MKTNIRSNWSHAVLICRKCEKKAAKRGLSFGSGKTSLAKALKKEMGTGKGRKSAVGIASVPCLDVCPKNGVVMIDTRTPGRWRIVRPDDDIPALARELREKPA